MRLICPSGIIAKCGRRPSAPASLRPKSRRRIECPKDHGQPTSRATPGSSRRRGRTVPKGRQIFPSAQNDILALLGDAPRRRDLLIEFLHLIQDEYGHISAAHLMALADEMKMAQAEVYEVATFYAHFDVVKEGEAPPPPVTVRSARICPAIWPAPRS
jgi:formate dehydrogenase